MTTAATALTIDPTPWGAWVALIGGVIVIVIAVCGGVAWLWKHVGVPDMERAFRVELDRREAKYAAEHAELSDRIDASDAAASTSIARVHDRIDKVHLRIDGLRPSA